MNQSSQQVKGLSPLEKQLRLLFAQGRQRQVTKLLSQAASQDVADALMVLEHHERQQAVKLLVEEQLPLVVKSLPHHGRARVLEVLSEQRVKKLLPQLELDDAADVLELLPEGLQQRILRGMPHRKRRMLGQLLHYPQDLAGGIMNPQVVRVNERHTVQQAVATIRAYLRFTNLGGFYNVFVVDAEGRLKGQIPAWRMILASQQAPVTELMRPCLVSVHPYVHQQEVARLAVRHRLVSVPVLNQEGQLIGRVTIDDIVDVIQREHHEDVGHLSGTGREQVRALSLWETLRTRMPWLWVALAGEFALAMFMQHNGVVLQRTPQLAFFIPLVMAMGGNAGVQSASLVLRGLASGEIRLRDFWRRMQRELLVAGNLGTLLALMIALAAGGLTAGIRLGAAVGLAAWVNIFFSTLFGTAIPLLLQRLGKDPALATGPFITTLNDILGVAIYLGIALWLL